MAKKVLILKENSVLYHRKILNCSIRMQHKKLSFQKVIGKLAKIYKK